eukprot:12401052-Karenia_brevis.AAC.2
MPAKALQRAQSGVKAAGSSGSGSGGTDFSSVVASLSCLALHASCTQTYMRTNPYMLTDKCIISHKLAHLPYICHTHKPTCVTHTDLHVHVFNTNMRQGVSHGVSHLQPIGSPQIVKPRIRRMHSNTQLGDNRLEITDSSNNVNSPQKHWIPHTTSGVQGSCVPLRRTFFPPTLHLPTPPHTHPRTHASVSAHVERYVERGDTTKLSCHDEDRGRDREEMQQRIVKEVRRRSRA